MRPIADRPTRRKARTVVALPSEKSLRGMRVGDDRRVLERILRKICRSFLVELTKRRNLHWKKLAPDDSVIAAKMGVRNTVRSSQRVTRTIRAAGVNKESRIAALQPRLGFARLFVDWDRSITTYQVFFPIACPML